MKANAIRKRTGSRPSSGRLAKSAEATSRSSRREIPPHITRAVAYIVIGIAVLGGWLITPVPVAIALTILAVIRIWIYQREVKREQAALETKPACPAP